MADLLFSVKNHIAYITLNRPEASNVFTDEMIQLWIKALEEVRDSEEIYAALLSGNGKNFCAGGDIKVMAAGKGLFQCNDDIFSTALARKDSLWKRVQRIPLLLQEIDKPVVVKMQGAAMGAGLDMALMCDIRIIADTAKVSESYLNVGVVPGDGGAYFLPRLVGTDRALDMFWNARILTGKEAKESGLATFCVSETELDQFAEEYMEKLAARPQQAMRLTKRAVMQSERVDLRTSLDMISSAMGLVTELSDYHDGVERAIQKKTKRI